MDTLKYLLVIFLLTGKVDFSITDDEIFTCTKNLDSSNGEDVFQFNCPPGPKGLKGRRGEKGAKGDSCDCGDMEELRDKIEQLSFILKVKDCSKAFWLTTVSQTVTNIYPYGVAKDPIKALCYVDSSLNKWTVIQRRINGAQDFFKNWKEYKTGFGNPYEEYWLGLETIHQLTSSQNYILRIELEDRNSIKVFAEYTTFLVGTENDGYRLNIGGYRGTAGDAMISHNKQKFATKDKPNDSGVNCPEFSQGAWWYYGCYTSNLNGLYSPERIYAGIVWFEWKRNYESLKSTTMMIKEK